MSERLAVAEEAPGVVALTEDPLLRCAVSAALDGADVTLITARPPFDTALLLDAACLLFDDRVTESAGPLLAKWRDTPEFERPPFFLMVEPGGPPNFPTTLLAEIDGVLTPFYGGSLIRRLVTTAIENRRLHDEIEELGRFAALGKTVAGVLHELKNPLNNVLGGLDRLDGLTEGDESLRRWRDMVRRNGDLLREALNELLGGFRSHGEPQSVDLVALLDRALSFVIGGDLNYRRQVAVTRDYASPAPVVRGNSGQLLHVFLNLLLNARQSFGDGVGALDVRISRSGDQAVVEIRDNGPGVPPDVLPLLFQRRCTTKRVGSGFGLALARDIVASHHGEIGAENNSWGGACFRVRLPAIESQASA